MNHVNALDYLVKPFSFDRLLKAIRKAEAHFPKVNIIDDSTGYTMRTARGNEPVPYSRINYIKAGDYFRDVHWDGGVAQLAMALVEIEKVFPKEMFVRVHKSYIVNKEKIARTKYEQLVLKKGETIPLSQTYKENLK